jgi:hypothetical protein
MKITFEVNTPEEIEKVEEFMKYLGSTLKETAENADDAEPTNNTELTKTEKRPYNGPGTKGYEAICDAITYCRRRRNYNSITDNVNYALSEITHDSLIDDDRAKEILLSLTKYNVTIDDIKSVAMHKFSMVGEVDVSLSYDGDRVCKMAILNTRSSIFD